MSSHGRRPFFGTSDSKDSASWQRTHTCAIFKAVLTPHVNGSLPSRCYNSIGIPWRGYLVGQVSGPGSGKHDGIVCFW